MISPTKRRIWSYFGPAALLASLLALSALPSTAQSDAEIDPGDAGRVRFIEGSVLVDRIAEDRTEEGATNAPVFAGDIVRTDFDGRVEVQLADGSLVRLDRGTHAEFRSLVDAYGSSDFATILRLSDGSLYLDVRGRRDSRGRETLLQVDTPLATIYIESAGLFRVDVSQRATALEVISHRGSAEVVGDDGSEFLRSGQRTIVETGYPPTPPARFNSYATDDFDRWNEKRMTYYVRTSGVRDSGHYDDTDYERVPSEVRPYAGELSSHGRWVDIPEYGLSWYPIGVGTAWKPYNYGHWSHGPHGWFWVSYDPWGWAPYRYGRWHHTGIYGWVWAPGSVYSGAHVSWYYGPSYVGWAPLNYYNHPAYINIGFSLGGYGCDPYVWNFVPYQKIKVKHVHKHKVQTVHVAVPELQKGHVTHKAVPKSPDAIARSPQARREAQNWARERAARDVPTTRVASRSPRSFSGGQQPKASLRSFRDGERDTRAKIARRTTARPGGERSFSSNRNATRERNTTRERNNPNDRRVVTRDVLPKEGVSLRKPASAKTAGATPDRTKTSARRTPADRQPSRTAAKTFSRSRPEVARGDTPARRPSARERTAARTPDREIDRGIDRRTTPRTFSRERTAARTGERAGTGRDKAPSTGNVRNRQPVDKQKAVRPNAPRTFQRSGDRDARTRSRESTRSNRPAERSSGRTGARSNSRGNSDDRLRQLFRGADRRRSSPSPGERARSGSRPSDRSRERAAPRTGTRRPPASARGGSSRGGNKPSARSGSSRGGSRPSAGRAPSKRSGGGSKKAAPRGKSSGSSKKGSAKKK